MHRDRVKSVIFILFLWFLLIMTFYWKGSKKLSGNVVENAEKSIKHFVYLPPPKTGSFITRHELRRYCRKEKLHCISQQDPCKNSSDCFLRNPNLKASRKSVFWAAFTQSRIKECCVPGKFRRKFDGTMFHFYLADPSTRLFLKQHTYNDSFRFTILRNPVNQFISFFNWITKTHRHLYATYIPLLKKPPTLTEAVNIFYKHRLAPRRMPAEYLILYNNLNNIQSRILGWNGSPQSLSKLIRNLDGFDFVGLTEDLKTTWNYLRKKMRLPKEYFDERKLYNSTSKTGKNISESLRAKINAIQWADAKLYTAAKDLFHFHARNGV